FTSALPDFTAPSATTGAASAVTAFAATIDGTVNANGGPTTVSVEYGTRSGEYTNPIILPHPVTGPADPPISAVLANLVPGTTSYSRVVAANAAGTTAGTEGSFTTGVAATTTTVSGLSSATVGAVVTFTATVASGNGAVTKGAVNF